MWAAQQPSTEVWKAGDKIDVKILEYDRASGRCKLSRQPGCKLP